MALEAETIQIQNMESKLKQLDLHIQNVESEKERVKEMIQKLELKEKEATIAKLVAEKQRLEQELSEATAIAKALASIICKKNEPKIAEMIRELSEVTAINHVQEATIAKLVTENQTLEQELSEVTAIVEELATICEKNNLM